jgi:cytoskeleton protein RodZ
MTKDRPQDRDRPAAGSAASALPQGSLGAWLRTQREARGVSLREIADSTKISVRYLEALEHDRFEILPAPVFTRGFLREYARVVGLDPDEAVNLFLLAADERPELPAEEPSPRAAGGPSPLGYGLLLLLGVVLLLGIAALVSWWARGRTGGPPEPTASPPAAAVQAPGDSAGEPGTAMRAAGGPAREPAPTPADPTRLEPDSHSVPTPAAAVPVSSAPVAQVATSLPPATPSAPAAAAPMRLVLEFSEDCWVELVVDGGRRTSELRTSGEVVNVEVERSVLLTVGNVAAVRVEVDGRPFPLGASDARVVRDLRIDRESVGRLTGGTPAQP